MTTDYILSNAQLVKNWKTVLTIFNNVNNWKKFYETRTNSDSIENTFIFETFHNLCLSKQEISETEPKTGSMCAPVRLNN